MLVIDNEDGTWNVVYNVRDLDRVWQDDEDEEEDVCVDRLRMAKTQELQPSRKTQQPAEVEPEGLHVVDPEGYENQEEFGAAVEQTMTSLLSAEAERAVTTVTALRDTLEFYQHGGDRFISCCPPPSAKKSSSAAPSY